MTRDRMRRTDRYRRATGEMGNHLIDEFLAGRLDRRALLRHGARLGIAAPLLGGVAGLFDPFVPVARAAGAPGATIRVGSQAPAGTLNPPAVADAGGLMILQQSGEFLTMDGPDLHLKPWLATSWSSNPDGSVWTFKLRTGVKFQNGKPMGADDVVATFKRLCDPKVGSNALSAFRGVLTPDGCQKVDDATVAFHLEAPNGNFPYYTSSDNYNAIILPADYAGDFEKNFIGTGPFKLEKYTPKVGISFTRNDDYWGPKPLPARVEINFYTDQQPMILALQGQQIDVITSFSVQGGQGLLNNPDVNVIKLRSSAFREVHMRCDMAPFQDKRTRRALALTLDRPAIIQGLLRGDADLGNDSPFAPIFPSTDPAIPQRKKDLAEAKQLLAAAGQEKGFSVTLTTDRVQEIPDYAVLIQNAAREIGIRIDLRIEDIGAYYGTAKFGSSDWLDSPLGITEYGNRGVPNVFLSAPLLSNGTWNAAHFHNPTYDGLVKGYIAALEPAAQREAAGKIQTLLLDETPQIYGYFYQALTATAKDTTGVQPTAMSQLFLQNASISS